MYELYVKNEKEDLIGEVTLKQEEEMEENLPEAGKLVINGYSKDTKVLAFSSNKGGLVMRATNSDGQRKLAGALVLQLIFYTVFILLLYCNSSFLYCLTIGEKDSESIYWRGKKQAL